VVYYISVLPPPTSLSIHILRTSQNSNNSFCLLPYFNMIPGSMFSVCDPLSYSGSSWEKELALLFLLSFSQCRELQPSCHPNGHCIVFLFLLHLTPASTLSSNKHSPSYIPVLSVPFPSRGLLDLLMFTLFTPKKAAQNGPWRYFLV
jgi:hypothetical protein